jgi:hypothetical protein
MRSNIRIKFRLFAPRLKQGGRMAYPEDLLGKYVAFALDEGGKVAGGADADGLVPGQTKPMAAKVYTKAEGKPFEALPVPWSFTFLKYVPGSVTMCTLHTATMTGPMSGCYLFTYRKGGEPYMAHVGTADAGGEDTKAAKAAWARFADANENLEAMGGRPFPSCLSESAVRGLGAKDGMPKVVGYFAGGKAYALGLAAVSQSQIPGRVWKVGAVKTMSMESWAAIKPKF